MQGSMRHLMLAVALLAAAPAALAQPASAPPGTPPGFVVPEPPKADETNAERAKTQPGNNAPFWRGVRESGENAGRTTLPGVEMGVLVQRFTQYPGSRFTTAGEAWREVRNRWIVPYGGALFLISVLAMAILYFTGGPIGKPLAPEGQRRIERFTPFERAAHWTNAIAFVILAVSGLVMAFGRLVLLPWMSGPVFGWLAYALKTVHNFVGPLFVVSLVIVIITFVRDELPRRGDGRWLRNVGAVLRNGPEVPSHRFNAGEKVVFWLSAVLLGLVAVGSGLVLDHLVPNLEYTRGQMQVAHMVHAIAAIGMMALLVVHIYLGTAGVRGAYTGMRHGWVDEHWAQEHHALWAEDIRAGKIPAQRSGAGAKPAEHLRGRPV
jgi:formate dehydrogenase subunit gamma